MKLIKGIFFCGVTLFLLIARGTAAKYVSVPVDTSAHKDQKNIREQIQAKASLGENSVILFKPQLDSKIMATDSYIRAEFDGDRLKRVSHQVIHMLSGRENMLESSKG